MEYEIESFGISDLGLVRKSNEDVFHEIPIHRFFVLADGMGGHNAGEIAAKEVVHHLSTSICQFFSQKEKSPSVQVLSNLLDKSIASANHWVHQLSEQKEELSGMGTTVCCLLLHQNSLVYANVGDSRIYRFRQKLVQITEDHSLFPSTAGRTGAKNIITRAVGTNPSVKPDVRISDLSSGDTYFLCSDGLTDYVSDEEITQILQETFCIKTASHNLVNAAKAKGGSDNITILMIRIC